MRPCLSLTALRLAVLPLAALPLAAQPLWLAPDEYTVAPGQRITVAFRFDGSPAPEPAQLRSAGLYTAQAAYNVVNLRREGDAVLGEATAKSKGTLALGVCVAPGRLHCAKALLVSLEPGGDLAARPLGLRFEIVPEQDPVELPQDAGLPLRVLLDGRPAAGVELTGGVRTTAEGRASVPIPHQCPCRISAVHGEFSTSLVFASAAAPPPGTGN